MSAEQFHVDVDNEEVLRKVGIKGTHFNKKFSGTQYGKGTWAIQHS